MRFLRYHAAVEQYIRDLGIASTFLRPNLFFQGLLAVAVTISPRTGSTPRSARQVRQAIAAAVRASARRG